MSAKGAAVLAHAHALGGNAAIPAAEHAMAGPTRRVEPDPSPRYDDAYAVHASLYQRLRPTFAELAHLRSTKTGA